MTERMVHVDDIILFSLFKGLLLLAVTCYACDDMDSSVCHRLATAKPDMCNDTCFASICQRFCGQCRKYLTYYPKRSHKK